MSMPMTSRDELPVFFPARDNELFGILTEPTSEPKRVGVIILSGGGTPLSTNVNRLSVQFCRRIAACGFHAFRFDYHGVGESSGSVDRFDLAAPFVADLEHALRYLRAYGLERFVLVGSCFGARTVLTAAPNIEGVVGVVLISPPIRDFEMGERIVTRMATELTLGELARRALSVKGLSGLLKADRRRTYARFAREKKRQRNGSSTTHAADREARYVISPRFLEPLRGLAERQVPLLLIYGDTDDFSAEFERAATTSLGEIVYGTSSIAVRTLSGTVHGFGDSVVAGTVFEIVTDWVTDLPFAVTMVTQTWAGQHQEE
jgi:pimeloyl-ACP methyl ester carboxylesterase